MTSRAATIASPHGPMQPAALLAAYRPGSSSLFRSPATGAILAEGVAAVVPGWTPQSRVAQAARELTAEAAVSGHPAAVVLGAIPFDEDLPARLFVPAHVQRASTLSPSAVPQAGASGPSPASRGARTRALVDPDVFMRGVETAVGRMRAHELRKVVLSRALELQTDAPIDVAGLLRSLAAREPGAYLFGIDLPRSIGRAGGEFPARPTRTLLGASPELLLRRDGRTVTTHPLAGSAPRSNDPAEDRRRAAVLKASTKDAGEHAVVVEAIADALAPLCSALDVPARPSLLRTSTMWHLGTPIRGELRGDSTALEVAMALHPTPAICGTPTPAARAAIAELEPYRRDFYCGLVGWMDAAGDGEWAVTIRCAQVEGNTLRAYAGAGIMPDSDPRAELDETTAKVGTLLRAFGLDPELALEEDEA